MRYYNCCFILVRVAAMPVEQAHQSGLFRWCGFWLVRAAIALLGATVLVVLVLCRREFLFRAILLAQEQNLNVPL